ncbi:helix-turn-helix domain-containing protein [Echinicola shivajiensis]|uniref:helix-turn-helix domain-containing protein n=1 Tax=Echinicola shivajiensis TaxID=1035916 RepID=UPI001BFC6D96|nr:helix-turn-helix transcriptional regulator [Echinicola shivajiensis]
MKENSFKEEKEALGYRIRELREKVIDAETNKPLSQEELGYRTGFAKKTIGEIERGNTNPTYETLLKISLQVKVSIKELYNFDMKKYISLAKRSKNKKENIIR